MTEIKNKYYSYSRLNTFENCPQKYKIQYIDKIKSKNEGIEAFIGKRIHESLEWLYENSNQNNFISFDRLADKFDQLWIEKWHKNIYVAKNPYKRVSYTLNQNQYKKIALNNLSLFYVKYFNHNNKTIYTELKVKVDIDGYIFKGIIDRIDLDQDELYVIDYKTGKSKLKLTLLDKLQLYIYQLAVEKKYKNKKIYLSWYYVNSKNGVKKISLNQKDKNKLNNKLLSILKNIEKSKYENKFPAKETLLCNWCYYWSQCSLKKDLNEKNPAENLK